MRTRTTVLLALALVVAIVLAWIDTPTTPPPIGAGDGGPLADQPAPGDIVRLLSFSRPSVREITLQRGVFSATLTRIEDGWSGLPAAEAAEEFLRGLQELAQIIVVGRDDVGPSDYGLDPPVARVTLQRSAGEPIELLLGHANPSSTGVYAQVGAQGPVVLTGALALWDLDKIVRQIQSAQPTPTTGAAAVIGEQPRANAQPIAPGQSDRFRVSFLKEETPAFATYRVAVIQTQSS